VSFRYPTFKIEDVANNDVFISGIATLNPAKFPIRLFDENELDDFKEKESLRNGLILGFISVLIILNLIIFSVFRLRPFGVFALSAFLFATLYLFLEGYFFGYWYSPALFENKILNFHYLIYFGFQLSNYWIFSSVFQLEIVKTGRFYTFFRILFLIGIIEGVLMLFSPLWYDPQDWGDGYECAHAIYSFENKEGNSIGKLVSGRDDTGLAGVHGAKIPAILVS
jgi:hypothetical protein